MFQTFQALEKVYRDQHMLLERSRVYKNILSNKEVNIIGIITFKIMIGIILGVYQLLIIKEMVLNKT